MATKTGDTTNNRLLGTAGKDELHGLGGNDILWGLGEHDKLYGGDDHDVLIGGAGSDWLYGGPGNDVLYDNNGYDPRDHMYGGVGNDVLVGDAKDKFNGGVGADVLLGLGGGTAFYNQSPQGVTVNLATGRGEGGEAEGDVLIGITRVVGSNGNDKLTGDEQDNYFRGRGGADVLDGGDGGDIAAYDFGGGGVTVDLGVTDKDGWTIGRGGNAEGDKLKNIESLYGAYNGDNTLRGDQKDNLLRGGAGDDVLEGRGGADELDGDKRGSDTASYEHSPGGVTVDLTLTGKQATVNNHHAAGDTLSDIENLRGSAHADRLTGDANANVLEGGAGADTLNGGGGSDTASYAHSAGGVTVNLTLTGPQATVNNHAAAGDTLTSIENLRGSAHADRLTGDANANVLEGGAGADTLNGGGGSDTASYAHSAGGVTVDLTLTGPQVTVNNHAAAGDTLTSIENLRGSDFGDRLTGNAEANKLFGGGGNDFLYGKAGGDTLHGGAGLDYLEGGDGTDHLYGEAESDLIYGGDEADHLYGGAGVDALHGQAGNDTLYGGAGNDALEGGAGNDHLYGGDEHDHLKGEADNDHLYGEDGTDILEGGAGADRLYGGAWVDVLKGEAGNDHLEGGAGADHLYGGTGADTFIFDGDSLPEAAGTLAGETDVVKDFSGLGADGVKQASEDGDKLDLSGLTEDLAVKPTLTFLATKGAAFSGVGGQVKWWQDGGQTHVQVDLDGTADANGEYDAEFQVTLDGLHDLTGADLILA